MNKIEKANVQYNDLKGSVAIDFYKGFSDLDTYAKEKGIDTERYNPIGFDIYFGESGSGFYLSFFVIDRQQSEKYKAQNNNREPVLKIHVKESYTSFKKRFKRFNIVATILGQEYENCDLIDSKELSELNNI